MFAFGSGEGRSLSQRSHVRKNGKALKECGLMISQRVSPRRFSANPTKTYAPVEVEPKHREIISRRERLKRRTLKAREYYNQSQTIAQSAS